MKHPRINFEKKYLYPPFMSRPNKSINNIFYLMRQIENNGLLDEVANKDFELSSKKRELHFYKVQTMKQLILNNKEIPENWIFKQDYQEILEEAMSDPFVLQYAIINADIFKKRAYPDLCKPKRLSKSLALNRKNISIAQNRKSIIKKNNLTIKTETEEMNKEEFLLTALDYKVHQPVKLPPISTLES